MKLKKIGLNLKKTKKTLLLEFLFHIFKATISCKNLRRVVSYYPKDVLKPTKNREMKRDDGQSV